MSRILGTYHPTLPPNFSPIIGENTYEIRVGSVKCLFYQDSDP